MSISVFDLDKDRFIWHLQQKTTPEDIVKWSPEIYAYLSGLFRENCQDSVLREWAFQWASDELGIDYDVIYKKWLGAK